MNMLKNGTIHNSEQPEMKFLSTKFEMVSKTVGELIELFHANVVIIDPDVQRKLDKKRAKEIAEYLRDALKGKSYGAYFPPICSSKRVSDVYAILDGQHRFFGAWEAINQIRSEIEHPGDLFDDSASEEDKRNEIETNKEHLAILENTIIPMMAYIGLSKEQEQQFFYDTNDKGKKVSQDLTLSFNHSDPLVALTRRVCETSEIGKFVQPLQAKKDKEKLFTFKNIYTTISTFLGNVKITEENAEENLSELQEFFQIVINSFPEDVIVGSYLYRTAGVLPGIALFAYKMKQIEKVCWKTTLARALQRVSLSNQNMQFVRIGRALFDQEKKVVTFSGSRGCTTAIVRTFEREALRLDKDGNEVMEAYYTENDEDSITVISEEKAEKVEAEVRQELEKAKREEESVQSNGSDSTLSASQKAILSALETSEDRKLVGSYKQIADLLNFARSTTTDSLKKLEHMGLLKVIDENGIKTVTLIG